MKKHLKSFLETTVGIELKKVRKRSSFRNRSYSSYAEALKHCTNEFGYQSPLLSEVVFRKTLQYRDALKSKRIVLDSVRSSVLSSVLLAAQGKTSLRVLDYGGACGAHYWLMREVFPQNFALDWQIVETKQMCAKAQEMANAELSFHSSLHEALSASFDLVLCSNSLQYSSEPWCELERMLKSRPKYLALLLLKLSESKTDEIHLQKSQLSENGIGALPPGFQDCEIVYPITSLHKSRLGELLTTAGYGQVLSFEPPLELEKSNYSSAVYKLLI